MRLAWDADDRAQAGPWSFAVRPVGLACDAAVRLIVSHRRIPQIGSIVCESDAAARSHAQLIVEGL